MRSAFAMFGTFLGVAGLYLTLGADFLAMTQVLIYAGGIMVLYLFGLMLTKPSPQERNLLRIGFAAGLVGAVSLILLVQLFGGIDERWPDAASLPDPEPTAEGIGLAFLRADEWLFAFEFASVLLLATLVGAVYIARRRPEPRAEELG
ncbi:MAG: NADH-quinone oxidoreductase subunit J [Planctomycetes bacterium]|nr:NADH-quinone oxidoreductase subunit J [Planctomycetota bacterium]